MFHTPYTLFISIVGDFAVFQNRIPKSTFERTTLYNVSVFFYKVWNFFFKSGIHRSEGIYLDSAPADAFRQFL